MLVSDGVFAEDHGPAVLDLYAGSGALGLEALSRGARSVIFVEHGRAAIAAIRKNATALDVADLVTIVNGRVERALSEIAGPFDLVLADPPYAEVGKHGFASIIESSARLLVPSGTLVLEHAATDEPLPATGLVLDRRRRHGDTTVSIFRATTPPETRHEEA